MINTLLNCLVDKDNEHLLQERLLHYLLLIFADEPTGALDSKSTQDLLKRLTRMNEAFKSTIIMVTHDPVAASYANPVVMLKDGQIFTELYQGDDDKHTFFKEIIRVQSVLGGVNYDL